MSQTPVQSVENNFTQGLITEATGLNFPENAVTETYNCEFNIDGSVNRRIGLDFEETFSTKTINRTDTVVNTFLWTDVAGDGNTNVIVAQVGGTLYFYESDDSGNFSPGASSSTVTLSPVSGAPASDTVEAQYANGNGYLFVTHPYCDPMRISYDPASHTASPTSMDLLIRDFEGDTADPNAVDTRPTSTLAALDHHHLYNIYNQGWNSTNAAAWDTAQTTMPSNADVMWRFVDSSNNFDATTASIARVIQGNTPAPKGHYIFNLSSTNRTSIGGSGCTETTTGFYRPSTCAFFAGRVFYAGVNAAGFNSNIYFTQIIQNTNQYGYCYQQNDPTASDLFDLLPDDGGVILIQEAGTVYKLMTVPGGLCVFAANGVWYITGDQGQGFSANDYSIQKIAEIATLSATSFVSVAGSPCWWNGENIYMITQQQTSTGAIPVVQPMTFSSIKTFYDAIPMASKRLARGFYNGVDGHIRWLFKSVNTNQLTNAYEYDRILNYNIYTKAFYPWSISPSDVKVNSIVSTSFITRPVTSVTVIDGSDTVIDASGDTVIDFEDSGSSEQQHDKYFVSYPNSGSYKFTFAERNDVRYLDWFSYDTTGVDYTSYFITGYKLRGNGIRRFTNNYIRVFSRLSDDIAYTFRSLWDYATTGSGTGRWSTSQLVEHDDTGSYSSATKRLKVRGMGIAMQFKITSVTGKAFDIIGWASTQPVNSAP